MPRRGLLNERCPRLETKEINGPGCAITHFENDHEPGIGEISGPPRCRADADIFVRLGANDARCGRTPLGSN